MAIRDDIILTVDVDWAPDEVIYYCVEKFRVAGIGSTWFMTHHSPALEDLARDPLFELGIHPNFLPGSSHGEEIEDVVSFCRNLVPNAVSTRSHASVQSGPILDALHDQGKVLLDSTIMLPEVPNIQPFKHLLSNGEILRAPIYWADAYEIYKDEPRWDPRTSMAVPGLKVYDFHPIHIFLNTPNAAHYMAIKERFPRISEADPGELAEMRHKGEGADTMLDGVISGLEGQKVNTLADLLAQANIH